MSYITTALAVCLSSLGHSSGPPGYFFLVSILTRNILYTISWKVPPSDTNQDTFVGNIVKTFVLGSILIEN